MNLSTRFKKGDILQGSFGWQEYAVSDGKTGYMRPFRIPRDVPITAPLGILGNNGLTAYFGLTGGLESPNKEM